MTPIVNGLEAKTGGSVVFHYLNARDGAVGEEAYRRYNLRGHPVILFVDTSGEVLWERSGIITASEFENLMDMTDP